MNKIIASLALAIPLTVVLSACQKPAAEAANAAEPFTQATAPLPGVEKLPDWKFVSENENGKHYIDRASWARFNPYDGHALAMFKTEFNEPVGQATTLETLYEFDCTAGNQTHLVSNTYDQDGNHLRSYSEVEPFTHPEDGTLGAWYQKVACTPARPTDGEDHAQVSEPSFD